MLMFSLHIRWSRNGSLAKNKPKVPVTTSRIIVIRNRTERRKIARNFRPKLEFPFLICGRLKACGQQMQFLADHLIPINRLLALSFIWQIANNRVILALKLTLERSIRARRIICWSLVKRLILCFKDCSVQIMFFFSIF